MKNLFLFVFMVSLSIHATTELTITNAHPKEDTTAVSTLETAGSVLTEELALYQNYSVKISKGLAEFRSLIHTFEEEDTRPAPPLIIESKSITGRSTQGGELTRFMTPEGKIVRYTFEIFGETGKGINNYYYFNNGLIYVQIFRMEYADWNFYGSKNRYDILQYFLESYIIDKGKIIAIDDTLNVARQIESDKAITSIDKLNDYFANGEDNNK